MNIQIHGESDDNVDVDVDGKSYEEYSAYDTKIDLIIGGLLGVTCVYGFMNTGCWGITPRLIDEDIEIPDDWNIQVKVAENKYSTLLVIDIPEKYGRVSIVPRFID